MSTDQLQRLGAFIRDRREELGISRRELARRANIADVSRLEQGRVVNPRRDTLQALAEALNLTLSELVAVGKAPSSRTSCRTCAPNTGSCRTRQSTRSTLSSLSCEPSTACMNHKTERRVLNPRISKTKGGHYAEHKP